MDIWAHVEEIRRDADAMRKFECKKFCLLSKLILQHF